MKAQNNVRLMQIAKDISRTTALHDGTTTVIGSYTDLADGEVIVTDPSNRILDTDGTSTDCSTVSKIKLIQRSGTNLLVSDVIDVGNVVGYKIATYSAAAQQIDYIGYNGSTNSFEELDNYIYSVRINWIEDDVTGQAQKPMTHGVHKSDSSTTQLKIAAGLHESLVNNMSRIFQRPTQIERVYSGAQLDVCATATLGVVYGSKSIVFSEDMTGTVTADSILRVGTSGAGTAPCYIITGHDSGVAAARIYTLDVPWQGTTNSAVAAGSVETCATGGDWGIQLTGLSQPQKGTFKAGKDKYKVIRFETGADCGSATTLTQRSTASNPGQGVWEQIAEEEYFCQGNEGNFYRKDFMHTSRADVVNAETYDVLTLKYYDDSDIGTLGGTPRSYKEFMCAIATTAAQADTEVSAFVSVIDSWLVTDWAIPGMSVQTGNLTA